MNVDTRTFAGAFLIGLAMFATLFLGVVLAVFLTIGVVSGDAERGLLQPLVVRPVGRSTLLLSRFLGAAGVCVAYVLLVYFSAMVITGLTGHWWPDRIVAPALELAFGVVIVIALSLLGSIVLSSTANGIAIFMLFGAGLVAGLLGTIGHALNSHAVKHASTIAAWALAVRSAVPRRVANDHGEGIGAHRLPAAARPVRRRVRPRLGHPGVVGRLPDRGRRDCAVRVLSAEPLSHRDLAREPRVLRDQVAVRLQRSAAALAVEVGEDERRHRLARDAFASRGAQRVLDQRLDVLERSIRRPPEQQAAPVELPVCARYLRRFDAADSTRADTSGPPAAA